MRSPRTELGGNEVLRSVLGKVEISEIGARRR
jgi:hypothetical protein